MAGVVGLTDEQYATFSRLSSDLSRSCRDLERLDAYYEGVHRLERLGLAVPPELEMFTTTVNWPRITVDSVEQRCDLEGFRRPGNEESDDELWGIWQANDLDEESQQAHLDALVFGRSYVCVGGRDEDDAQPDIPLITVESPFEMTHEADPRTRRVTAALRRTGRSKAGTPESATLYLPDETIWLERNKTWQVVDRDEHSIGWPLVVPLVNRPRTRHRQGVSEMADVISLTDAAARALTNAQVATEVLAVPQRYVVGASPKDFVDQDGNPVTAWETYFGAVWALHNSETKLGQFAAADLGNFEKIVNHYAALASGVSGLPTRFYGQYTTNPPTEGSIVADESRLIMNAYRKHRTLGGSWERTMRLVRRLMDGDWDPSLSRLEVLWRSPETPTRAQQADATVKLRSQGIISLRQARRDLGYSQVEISNMESDDAEESANDPLTKAAASFRQQVDSAGNGNAA